ncbi:MAG: BREX-1 system phosphatase PglZ type B [Planctomycetaceae bacterium]|nr:BREX-1 system phosphatase PglZ type B [Planctomycetaceae bacterium]
MPTVLDTLLVSIRSAADSNHDDAVAPAVVLWTDDRREFGRLLPRLRLALPQLLTLGPHDPSTRTGPAIWLRCVLAGKVGEVSLPADAVPIIYLAGVNRSTLRATDECPPELSPLAELQYRGVFWSQNNGKDWTVSAFLQAEKGGLNLRIARDSATLEAIHRAFDKLVDEPIADLLEKSKLRPLDSHDFDKLIVDDPVDDLLTWLSDPQGSRQRWELGRWEALCSRGKTEYGFDPLKHGELESAERLGRHAKPAWKAAWNRFTKAPGRYPGLVALLKRAKPKSGDLLEKCAVESWPQDNEAEEAKLRQALNDLTKLPVPAARKRVLELDQEHGMRRDWVWAKLGKTPLAHALDAMNTLATETAIPLTGATIDDVIQSYTTAGWAVDAAVLDALAAVSSQDDRAAVSRAIGHIYNPWLRDLAEQFQERFKTKPLPGREVTRLQEAHPGTVILFADGLRFDVGQKLKALLEAKGLTVQLRHHTVALPSVTPTSKPAISPVVRQLAGLTAGEEFRPSVAANQKDLTIERFRKLLDESGFQVLTDTETGEPEGRAWAEYGDLDQTGHREGLLLARRIRELLAGLVERIESLLAAGWQEVRVVTDHGWLLVPGGLPKADLPKYLVETRWGRCAVVKPHATVDYPSFPWFWAEDVRVACPYGIDCFVAGKEYSHGGLSVQECVVPQLTIRRGAKAGRSAKITRVRWGGLRCRVTVQGEFAGCLVDLRDKPADPSSSLSGAKPVGKDGTVALFVADDSREGTATNLVLLDVSGTVLEKMPLNVGE